MNKLTKVGLSALCGSLAAVASANAGEMTVKGGATATWSSNQKDVSGNPIGLNSGLTFTGSGELDNGTTFTLTLTNADQAAYSAGSIALTTPSVGSINISGATGGNGIGGYDDKMPTAWEETWGTSLGTGIDLAKGSGSSMNIQYKTPSMGGTTIALAYAPKNDGKKNNDKGVSGGNSKDNLGASWDAVLDVNYAGQNVFVGYSVTERPGGNKSGTNTDANSDKEEGVAGAIFSIGPIKLGAQVTGEWLGNEQTAANVAGYKNVAYGASFNINDDLSISYGRMESKKGFVSQDGTGGSRIMEVESFQIAYTMGGATIKLAETSGDNLKYSTGSANSKDATTIALSLAF
jgi:outer membrane protein OmpU